MTTTEVQRILDELGIVRDSISQVQQRLERRAIDFGDARNPRSKLNAWYQWALQNRDKYGFSEVLDEGDHIHVAF